MLQVRSYINEQRDNRFSSRRHTILMWSACCICRELNIDDITLKNEVKSVIASRDIVTNRAHQMLKMIPELLFHLHPHQYLQRISFFSFCLRLPCRWQKQRLSVRPSAGRQYRVCAPCYRSVHRLSQSVVGLLKDVGRWGSSFYLHDMLINAQPMILLTKTVTEIL